MKKINLSGVGPFVGLMIVAILALFVPSLASSIDASKI